MTVEGQNAAVSLGRHNPLLARLRRASSGREPGLTVVDGLKLLGDLLGHGVRPESVYTDPARIVTLLTFPEVHALAAEGRLYAVEAAVLERLAPTRHTQGVLAVVPRPAGTIGAAGTVVYLDRVQDPGNVGAAVRSAAAFGAAGVACSPGCADPFSPRAIRASGGQSLLLPVQHDAAFEPLADAFHAAGGLAAGTAGAGGTPVQAWRPAAPLLLAFGNEGQGLSPEVASRCDDLVTVPLAAGVESLNLAVAVGVVLAVLSQGPAASPRRGNS